jgi:hypothetical protein
MTNLVLVLVVYAVCDTGNWLLDWNNPLDGFNGLSVCNKPDGTCELCMTTTMTEPEAREKLARCIPPGALTNIRMTPNLFGSRRGYVGSYGNLLIWK